MTQPQSAWDGVAPLDWYALMHQAETIRGRYYLGLASVWAHINRRDYNKARAALDRVVEDIKLGRVPARDDIRSGYWCPERDWYGRVHKAWRHINAGDHATAVVELDRLASDIAPHIRPDGETTP